MLKEAGQDSNLSEENVESLKDQFKNAETVVLALHDGNIGISEGKEKLKNAQLVLENLTREVSALSLFSDNEIIDELPTESLPFLLLPAYLGYLHGNTCTDFMLRLDELRKTVIYYKDFLRRIKEYEIMDINLWWKSEDSTDDNSSNKLKDVEQSREEKIRRFNMQKEIEAKMKSLNLARERGQVDESDIRELHMNQLKLWANKIFDELLSVEAELPLVERMISSNTPGSKEREAPSRPAPSRPLQTFTITRDQQQKKVFGLGYPSIPTLTVDEWYNQRFKQGDNHGAVPGPSNASLKHDDHDDCSSKDSQSDDSDAEEERRQERMRMDEYKDTHRRGWGNTHNKG